MTFVRHIRVVPPALLRPALVFVAIAQLVLAFAPLIEGQAGADARPHVEAEGTGSHHAHDAGDCTGCIVRSLVATLNHAAHPASASHQSELLALPEQDGRIDSPSESSSRPRAPPLRQA